MRGSDSFRLYTTTAQFGKRKISLEILSAGGRQLAFAAEGSHLDTEKWAKGAKSDYWSDERFFVQFVVYGEPLSYEKRMEILNQYLGDRA